MSTETLYRLRPTVADSDLHNIGLGVGGLMMLSLRKHAFAVGDTFEWYGKGPARTITSCPGFRDLAGIALLERFIEPVQLLAGGTREDIELDASKTPRLERPDGAPAFPVPPELLDGATHADWRGMTLRDFLASRETLAEFDFPDEVCHRRTAEALAGRPHPTPEQCAADPLAYRKWEADWRAALRYLRADAMLRAREAKP